MTEQQFERGDTIGKRETNQTLKVGDLWCADVRWWPLLQQAMQTLSTAKMARPDGLDAVGEYWLRTEVIRDTNLIRYVLWYRETKKRGPGTGGVKIGWFILDYLPEKQRRPEKKVQTHGKTVIVRSDGAARHRIKATREIRVLVDDDGLPVPVPPEIWLAMCGGVR